MLPTPHYHNHNKLLFQDSTTCFDENKNKLLTKKIIYKQTRLAFRVWKGLSY